LPHALPAAKWLVRTGKKDLDRLRAELGRGIGVTLPTALMNPRATSRFVMD
jgi:hypothetical protein